MLEAKRKIGHAIQALVPYLKRFARQFDQPEAKHLMELYQYGRPVDSTRGRLLFWVPGGMPLMLHVEGALAAALRLRGVDVHAVICDGPFRACVRREAIDSIPVSRWQEACTNCRRETKKVLEYMGVPYSFIGDFLPEKSRKTLWEKAITVSWDNVEDLEYAGINIGKNVHSAILRYLRGHELAGHEEVVPEYAYSGLAVAAAVELAIERFSPSRIFLSHGTYVDWGPAVHAGLYRGIPVTAWMASYLKARFFFRHLEDRVRIDFHNMSPRAWESTARDPLIDRKNARLEKFLEDRYKRNVSFDMKRLMKYTGKIDSLRRKYRVSDGKPVWGIMSHINWDCVSDFSPMAYETFDEWILDTIREIADIESVQWLIKIHPAEAWDNPSSGVHRLINRHFPELPPHVQVIPAEEQINPAEFIQIVDGGVTVYGTLGLELALVGKPVIVAGEAHYAGKGFTYEGLTPESYRALLRKAKTFGPMSKEKRELARKYAYCYFIQRQILFPVVEVEHSQWWEFNYQRRHLLLEGRDPFVDFICNRILDGEDFIMDEPLLRLSER
jgi:hypothetical protein